MKSKNLLSACKKQIYNYIRKIYNNLLLQIADKKVNLLP
jgi:hypothetical protein